MEDIRPGFTQRPTRGFHWREKFWMRFLRNMPKIIKAGGISAILAKTFARIFYRNAINLGLPLIECDTDQISEGDVLRVNLARGEVFNETRDASIQAHPMPEFMVTLLNEGGTANFIRKHGKFQVPKVFVSP
jgi:3-isopropylmalate/(R)-2-methylmalate dehydratase small subunit